MHSLPESNTREYRRMVFGIQSTRRRFIMAFQLSLLVNQIRTVVSDTVLKGLAVNICFDGKPEYTACMLARPACPATLGTIR